MNPRRIPTSSPGSKTWSPDARRSAATLLEKLSHDRCTLEALLDEIDGTGVIRDPRDRGLLQALVFGVLRWQGRLDFILSRFSKTPLDKIEPAVRIILRLALFQLLFLTRIPASAAVHSAVEIAKATAGPWVAPFVNAVLRRAAREHLSVAFPDRDTAPVAALSTEWSCPEWLVARWVGRYGVETTAGLCAAINELPPLTLRANTLKASRDELAAAVQPFAINTAPARTAPDAVHISGLKTALGDLQAFHQGWFQVQDEAAQLVSILLDPQPGEVVLDACAGRGGKTGHIAQLMQNRGHLIALDQSASRLSQLKDEMGRLGVSSVSTCKADLMQPRACNGLGPFDRILLDAPCSGLGTLRRNPDIKWSAHKKDLQRYHRTQARLLEQAAARLKPDGAIVYAVCSTEPEETVDVVRAFLAGNRGFRIDGDAAGLPQPVRPLVDAHGFLQTYPRLSYMDGFFAVRLRIQANA